MRPAGSEAFGPDVLGPVAALALDGPITPAWAWGGADGSGVRVALIDSGVEADHPAVGAVASAVTVEHRDGKSDAVRITQEAPIDVSGHGTACAAIIRGLAPRAELHSVRVLDRELRASGSLLAAGLRWSIDHGMDVVNLSLSSRKRDEYERLYELADTAYFRNVMLVCAVSNVPGPSYPSQFASVLSVAACEAADPFALRFNSHPPAELGARGIDVDVPWGSGAIVRKSGNSFAAANISGLVARILSKHPQLTPFQLKTVLHALSLNATTGGPAARPFVAPQARPHGGDRR